MKSMPTFSIKHMMYITFLGAICAWSLAHPTAETSLVMKRILAVGASAAVVYHFVSRQPDTSRFAAGGVCAAGSLATMHDLGFPDQLYLCGGQHFGYWPFYANYHLWHIFNVTYAAVFGFAVAFGFSFSLGRKVRRRVILAGSFGYLLIALALVDQQSGFVASSSQFLANTLFHFSIVAALFTRRNRRWFWGVFASCIWLYLRIHSHYLEPWFVYLGPTLYLWKYYPSGSAASVTANALCSVLFATWLGLACTAIRDWLMRESVERIENR